MRAAAQLFIAGGCGDIAKMIEIIGGIDHGSEEVAHR